MFFWFLCCISFCSPKIEEFAKNMMADVVFLKVDVDECEEVAR